MTGGRRGIDVKIGGRVGARDGEEGRTAKCVGVGGDRSRLGLLSGTGVIMSGIGTLAIAYFRNLARWAGPPPHAGRRLACRIEKHWKLPETLSMMC